MSIENAPELPGLELKKDDPNVIGPVETGISAQIEQLTGDGWITGHHAGFVALAIRAARDVDQSAGKGAPSGRANLLRVMNEILDSLPHPEDQSGDALDKALAAILDPAQNG